MTKEKSDDLNDNEVAELEELDAGRSGGTGRHVAFTKLIPRSTRSRVAIHPSPPPTTNQHAPGNSSKPWRPPRYGQPPNTIITKTDVSTTRRGVGPFDCASITALPSQRSL
eukprot:scaffold17194_cov22-Cyclotella_meneghiniana.AAC.2